MKKLFFTLLFACLCASPLFALRPGDRALKLDKKVRAVRGQVPDLSPLDAKTPQPELRAVVFLLCRAVNSASTVAMLSSELDHVIVLSVALSGFTVATSVAVWPTSNSMAV